MSACTVNHTQTLAAKLSLATFPDDFYFSANQTFLVAGRTRSGASSAQGVDPDPHSQATRHSGNEAMPIILVYSKSLKIMPLQCTYPTSGSAFLQLEQQKHSYMLE